MGFVPPKKISLGGSVYGLHMNEIYKSFVHFCACAKF